MLRLALCDDLPGDLAKTRTLVEDYRKERPSCEIEVSCYQSPFVLLRESRCGRRHDVYLLDILMPGMDGVQLGRALRRDNQRCAIIFGTITPEYALDSYQVGAQNYLLKPFSRESMFKSLDRAVAGLDPGRVRGVSFRTIQGACFLPFHMILSVECRDRVMSFRLTDGQEVGSVTLRGKFEDALADLLADPRFCQPHKSFVVNMDHVRYETHGYMELLDGSRVPVAARRRRALLDQYLDYSLMHR